jgi:hypothetical protein
MKLILALFISLQIITNNTFVEDIARIPVLVEHYQHHQQEETPNISFAEFISMHYGSDANESNDIHHHSLPLKHTNDVGHIHLLPVFTLPESKLGFSIIPVEIEHNTFHAQFIPNHNLDAIFQPPKSC